MPILTDHEGKSMASIIPIVMSLELDYTFAPDGELVVSSTSASFRWGASEDSAI